MGRKNKYAHVAGLTMEERIKTQCGLIAVKPTKTSTITTELSGSSGTGNKVLKRKRKKELNAHLPTVEDRTSLESCTPKKKRKMQKKRTKTKESCVSTNSNADVTETSESVDFEKVHDESPEPKELTSDSRNKLTEKTIGPAPVTDLNPEQSSLRSRLSQQLTSARFRFINEQLYTRKGSEAKTLFEEDPLAFQIYHAGYEQQQLQWPSSPLDSIIHDIKKKARNTVVADMGCGDAKLSQQVKQKVHSFDLVAMADGVVACDMSQVPLPSKSVNVCVFCLSLMGTNVPEFLVEANRILRIGGELKIAEITSRFVSLFNFKRAMGSLGFEFLKKKDLNDYFTLLDFKKVAAPRTKKPNGLELKPCLYKKR